MPLGFFLPLTNAKLPQKEIDLNVSVFQPSQRMIERSRSENNRNGFLDFYLENNQIDLPDGRFLLIAKQPNGIVTEAIIIDFETEKVRLLPGTHYTEIGERIGQLEEIDRDFLIRFLESDLMENFPSSSGRWGLDGHSLVVYFRTDSLERQFSHWIPEHVGMSMFDGILEKFYSQRRPDEEMREFRKKQAEPDDTDNPANPPENPKNQPVG